MRALPVLDWPVVAVEPVAVFRPRTFPLVAVSVMSPPLALVQTGLLVVRLTPLGFLLLLSLVVLHLPREMAVAVVGLPLQLSANLAAMAYLVPEEVVVVPP